MAPDPDPAEGSPKTNKAAMLIVVLITVAVSACCLMTGLAVMTVPNLTRGGR